MPLSQHELDLHGKAIRLIQLGSLPGRISSSLWAGPGVGRACALCDQLIPPTEMEYELGGQDDVCRLHLRCHAIWQLALSGVPAQSLKASGSE